MELTKEILKELTNPFPADRISIKVQTKPNENGNSLCVAYIDARNVMDRLDSVVGGEWSDIYRLAPSGGLECALTVCGVTRCDVGDDKNENETEKAGYSDSFKRAAVKFGVGRFLYDLPKMYGKVKTVGKNSYLENGEEQRLQGVIADALNGQKPSNRNGQKTTERKQDLPVVTAPTNAVVWSVAQKDALIKADYAKNDFAAKGMLGLSNLPSEAMPSEIIAWGKVYREYRTAINPDTKKVYTAQQAAEYANDAVMTLAM